MLSKVPEKQQGRKAGVKPLHHSWHCIKMQEFDNPEENSVGVGLLMVNQMAAKGNCVCVLKVVMEVVGAEKGLHSAGKKAK